ncbi:MAG: hypothetical protein P1V20_31475 [Verrucomicrobiales bacterium]|nr:hypothetical protein [Verrucomicrobiales bacterium]
MKSFKTIAFSPAGVEGVQAVTEVVIHFDRVVFHGKNNSEQQFLFCEMNNGRSSKIRPWWKSFLPKPEGGIVGEREFCKPPGEQYFRWFTSPQITTYTPPDADDVSYDQTLFYRIHEVMSQGPFRTLDLS